VCRPSEGIGIPEALSAGVSVSEGAAPPSAGAGEAGAPNLDTQIGTSRPLFPSRTLPFRPRWLTLDQYREQLARWLRYLALYYTAHGKRRRSFVRKARQLLECGQLVRFLRCKGCEHPDASGAYVLTRCDLRACPSCARRRADLFRDRLTERWEKGERPRRMSLYLLTFTLKYDPTSEDDLSIEGLQRRRRIVLAGVRRCWRRYLKARGRAMAFALEVSPRGAVHVHALYHGHRPNVTVLRMLYMDRVGASPQLNVLPVHQPRKAIREVAKYMVKAASPKRPSILAGGLGEFTDPELAARIEVAFSGERLVECLGKWRGADSDEDSPEVPAEPCERCGCIERRMDHMPLRPWLALTGGTWIACFGRAGPDPPSKTTTSQGEKSS
jgi:hypothetical protein